MGINYTDGNKWLKWDLHLHTPDSVFNNGYRGNDKEKVWDTFISNIERSDIDVLGITDYYSISGYKKVLDYKKSGRLKNIKEIFPNVEVRLSSSAKGKRFINYHIIFSPEVANKIEESFITQLEFKEGRSTCHCKRNDLIDLAKDTSNDKDINKKSDEELYKIGLKYFKADIEQINILLQDKKFAGKSFRIVAGDNDDGVNTLIGNGDDQGWGIRNNILLKSDALFTTNKKTISIFMGNHSSEEKEMVLNQQGGLKPCFQGSDAHSFNDYFNEKWTWIKAEPSFSGLLQTKFEPERRVKESKYSKNNPSKKNDTEWIQSLEFNDSSFQSKVLFNPGLNAIIGGKSSGKSMLLYEIAKAADPTNVENVNKIKGYHLNNYDDIKGNAVIKLGNQKIPDKGFRVDYIPQLFINSISEDYKNQELQKIIKNNLNQNETISRNIQRFEDLKSELKKDLEDKILAYSDLTKEEASNKDLISKKGNPKDIRNNLKTKTEEYKSLSSELNLEKAEATQLKEYLRKKENINKEKVSFQSELTNLEKSKIELNKLINNIEKIFKNAISDESLRKDIEPMYNTFLKFLKSKSNEIDKNIEKTEKKIVENAESEINISNDVNIKTILDKLDRKKELVDFQTDIELLERNLSIVNQTTEKSEINKKKMKTLELEINQLIDSFISNVRQISRKLNNKRIGSTLSLKTPLDINQERYSNEVMKFIDKRRLSKDGFPIKINSFSLDNFADEWTKIIIKVLNHEFDDWLKRGYSSADLTGLLTMIPIDMPINLNKEEDDLSKMSPGKRAIVVLELLLEGNSLDRFPILIDQPEDNLDNRSISTELVPLLREISSRRQVIIVTHNANLVVLTDADEVIVANQDPEILENQNNRFEYISGPLENSSGFSEDNQKFASHGIRDDITDILEGGVEAFKTREKKYLLN